jgi:hypothetical protein
VKLRESRHVKVARIIYAQTQAVFPKYSHRFKKFTLPQLAACVLLCFYFKMSYRDFEELLLMSKELRDALELTRVPDYSTLNRMYHRFRASHLDKMNEALLSTLKQAGLVKEEVIAVDATGFRPTNASAYFQTRRGKPFRRWLKGGYAVGASSQMIVHGVGPSNDAPHLSTLKRRASRSDERGQPAWVTLADSGFDSAKIGPRDIILPIRRGGDLKAAQRSRVGIASSFRWPVWSALEGRDCSLCHQTQIR